MHLNNKDSELKYLNSKYSSSEWNILESDDSVTSTTIYVSLLKVLIVKLSHTQKDSHNLWSIYVERNEENIYSLEMVNWVDISKILEVIINYDEYLSEIKTVK